MVVKNANPQYDGKPKPRINTFQELERVDVTEHIEKKGRFNYLSWTFAVRELKRKYPDATWEVHEYQDRDGMVQPYMHTDCGYFVKTTVNVKGISMSQIHPVLDNYNKSISEPNAFQINTSIQRCLTKAIALHGLGLHIFAGEDLPPSTPLSTEERSEIIGVLETHGADKETYGKIVQSMDSGTINHENFLEMGRQLEDKLKAMKKEKK